MANHHYRAPLKPGYSTYNGVIIGKGAVAVQLFKVVKTRSI
jgi:hypothetical protein